MEKLSSDCGWAQARQPVLTSYALPHTLHGDCRGLARAKRPPRAHVAAHSAYHGGPRSAPDIKQCGDRPRPQLRSGHQAVRREAAPAAKRSDVRPEHGVHAAPGGHAPQRRKEHLHLGHHDDVRGRDSVPGES